MGIDQCACHKKKYNELEQEINKNNLLQEKKAAERKKAELILLKFFKYSIIKRKIDLISSKYFSNANYLLKLSSKMPSDSASSTINYTKQLIETKDKILSHLNKTNLIDIDVNLFDDLNGYDIALITIKNYYIKYIKEKEQKLYNDYFDSDENILIEQFYSLLNGKNSIFYKLFIDMHLEKKNVILNINNSKSNDLFNLIKSFLFFYQINILGLMEMHLNFVKLPITHFKKCLKRFFNIDTFNKNTLSIKKEIPSPPAIPPSSTAKSFKKQSQIDMKLRESIELISAINEIKSTQERKSKKGITKKTVINNTKIPKIFYIPKSEEEIEFYFYKGNYDASTLLPCGKGEIIKDIKKVYYNGTFRYGKKQGIGMYYKLSNSQIFIFYKGEWNKNKQTGYGLKIISIPNLITVNCGRFDEGKFISGIKYEIEENGKDLYYRKYEGVFESAREMRLPSRQSIQPNMNDSFNSYDFKTEILEGEGKYKEIIFSINKFDKTYHMRKTYIYEGMFVNGKENGKGELKIDDKDKNISYEYIGEFENGIINGYGKITYSENYCIKSYEGLFYKGQKFYLYGIVEFKSGDVYEGFFDEHYLKSEVGLYHHYDKEINGSIENFFGEFSKDKKEGLGRFVNVKKRKVLVGNYYLGNKNGIFSLAASKKNKKANEGYFDDNENEKKDYLRNSTINKNNHKLFFLFDTDEFIHELNYQFNKDS